MGFQQATLCLPIVSAKTHIRAPVSPSKEFDLVKGEAKCKGIIYILLSVLAFTLGGNMKSWRVKWECRVQVKKIQTGNMLICPSWYPRAWISWEEENSKEKRMKVTKRNL